MVAVAVGDRLSRSRDNDDSASSCFTQFYKLRIASVVAIEAQSQSPLQMDPDSGGKAAQHHCFPRLSLETIIGVPTATCPGLFAYL